MYFGFIHRNLIDNVINIIKQTDEQFAGAVSLSKSPYK